MKNILFNSEFRVLYESELYVTEKYGISRERGDSGAENDLFFSTVPIRGKMEFGHKEFGHLNFDYVQILVEFGSTSEFY